jgi:hypothetical protein
MLPGMHIPRLAREAGLARGCGEEEERTKNHPVNVRNHRVPGEPLAPLAGYSFGPRSPDRLLAAGLGSLAAYPSSPFPLQLIGGIMAVSPAPLAGCGAFIAGAPALTPSLAG